MENISILSYDDKNLNISNNLTLSMPSSVQGGSYFTKIHYAKRPLYMQSPKCVSKQGINTIGKKTYIELVVSNEKDGEFISFLENLEKTCIDIIFEKRHLWFTDELEKTDIETAFASIMKSYKNGTSQLLKLNINNTSNHAKNGIGIGGLQTCFVFDENNNSLKFDDVRPETQMITIIEFEGIKFTSKSFQFEMNARQMLIIDEKPIFNSCLIKPRKKEEQNEFHEESEKNDVDNKVNKTEKSSFISADNGLNNSGAAVIADNAEAENGMQNGMQNKMIKSEQEQKIDENEECLGELKVMEDLEIKTSQNENKKVNKENNVKKEENGVKNEENGVKNEENGVKN